MQVGTQCTELACVTVRLAVVFEIHTLSSPEPPQSAQTTRSFTTQSTNTSQILISENEGAARIAAPTKLFARRTSAKKCGDVM